MWENWNPVPKKYILTYISLLLLLITRISLQLPLSKLEVDFWRLIIISYVKIEILTPKKHIFKHMLVCYFYKLPGSASSCLQVSFKWPPVGQIWFLMWKLKSCTYQKKNINRHYSHKCPGSASNPLKVAFYKYPGPHKK